MIFNQCLKFQKFQFETKYIYNYLNKATTQTVLRVFVLHLLVLTYFKTDSLNKQDTDPEELVLSLNNITLIF